MIEPSVKIRSKLSIIKGKPDLTPLVDVLFLLLIFFLVSSSFIEISGIQVNLPKTKPLENKIIDKVIITIDSKSQYFYNDEAVGWKPLQQMLSELNFKMKRAKVKLIIVVRADRKTPFGDVAKLLALAESIKLTTVIATASSEQKKVIIDE